MLNKWIDDLGQEIENTDDAVAFAIFVFNRLECIGHHKMYHDFREVCQMYLDWRLTAERILRRSKAELHKVEGQCVLEKLYNQVDRAKLVMLLQEETDALNYAKRRYNNLISELKNVRDRIHA